jgi:hypothetical protein
MSVGAVILLAIVAALAFGLWMLLKPEPYDPDDPDLNGLS